ncbi:mechanosensitive ion channel family protein [Candidatus Micrarchaeota archaeon]|nr:mechanosensitive ion channel family protein [Candidatus Micrarchaeota archaeon]
MDFILDDPSEIFAGAPDILVAVGILLLGFLIGKSAQFLIQNRLKIIAKISTANTEYLLLKSLEKPLETLISIVTIYVASTSLRSLFEQKENMTNILFILVTLIAAGFVSNIISNFISRIFPVRNTRYSRSPKIVDKILVTIVYLMAILVILGHFSVDITPLIAALGILGLAVSLSLQDSVANLFAGLYLVSSSPIRVGDYIEITSEKVSGYVEDINWRETKVRTLDNTLIVLPNTKISQSVVINTSLPEKDITVSIDCKVSNKSDLDQVEKITLEVAKNLQQNTKGAVKSFEPILRYDNFEDAKVHFTIVLMAEEYMDSFQLRHEFIKALKREFGKKGIE